MNLNRLLNSKYLFQNIKKSKMTIALFFAIVPIFTSLMIIAADDYTFEFGTLSAVNIMGMYIIPFIFSISLFGYVFKKNSVDFMGSMPISRKCIFITNTIGGIALIFLMQLVTFFLTLLIGSLTKGIVFASMAWDILLFQTISYIFVFMATNLAMSVSGNLVTQIAVTMLIVFVVPFSTWYVNMVSGNTEYKLMNNNIEIFEVNKIQNYTAPFLIANNGEYMYNSVSMWKMIILSVLYFVIGYFVFQRRKMEVAGESFENKYIHFVVKGLTLIPFVAVLKEVANLTELTLSVILIAIIFVYFIIFDLITSKKMKFIENIIAVIVSIATLYGGYSIAIGVNEKIDKKLNLDSIQAVNINVDNSFYTKLTDKNKIKSSMAILSKAANNYSYYEETRYFTEIGLVKNDGTRFRKTIYLNGKMLKDMFNDSFKNDVIGNNAVISNTKMYLTKKDSLDIIKFINESYKGMTLKDLLDAKHGVNYSNIILSEYKNHQLVQTYYPVLLNKDIQKIMMNAYNQYAVECLKSGYSRMDYTIDSFGKFDEETKQKVWFAIDRGDRNVISEFILNQANDLPEDISKSIKISTYEFQFYTDKIDDFLEIINKICEENKEEFENYQKEYLNDYYSSFPERISSLIQTEMIEENNDQTYKNAGFIIEMKTSGENLQANISGDTI